ncbi:MAG TPA: hypothetical protein EYQ25_01430 [Planctomycetes bacterium]|nr:hypothetical protein [Planctomycetota bacterium]HIL36472.1 hypothetical protein [Planctomycetota bacterium]
MILGAPLLVGVIAFLIIQGDEPENEEIHLGSIPEGDGGAPSGEDPALGTPREAVLSVEEVVEVPVPKEDAGSDLADPFANFKETGDLYPLPWGEEPPPWPEHERGELEEKYKDATLEELKAAYERTGLEGQGALVVELARKREAGEYELWPMHFELDENGEKIYQGMNLSFKSRAPFYTTRVGPGPDGEQMVQFIWAEPHKNRDAYLAFSEHFYLNRRITQVTGFAPQNNIAWEKLGTFEQLFGGTTVGF